MTSHAPQPTSGRALLTERIAGVGALLDELESTCASVAGLPENQSVIATGIGASEGPARLLASELRARGRLASFEPLSSLASTADLPSTTTATAHLVLVSQGLSPNARLAIAAAERFSGMTVVTSTEPLATAAEGTPARLLHRAEAAGARIVVHPPHAEPGLLVRVLGPAAASLVALRLAGVSLDRAQLGERHRAAGAAALHDIAASVARHRKLHATPNVAFVTAGGTRSLAYGFRWKLLEAAGIPDPPVWDVLQFAHGPFQQIHARPVILCALERPGDGPLVDRLAQMLVPERHLLLRSRATLDGPLAFFEHDAFVNALALELVADRDLEIGRWPGHGADAPLYGFDGSE